MLFRSNTPLDEYLTGQPMSSHRSVGASDRIEPYKGSTRPAQPQQMRHIAKMAKR